jgi:hypothetical protein
MSAGTRVWRTIERATRTQPSLVSAARPDPVATVEQPAAAVSPLARLLFFSSEQRTRIFFADVDGDDRVSGFCELIGKTIATVAEANVAVVHGAAFNSPAAGLANEGSKPFPEYTCATHITENLWRVPFSVFEAEWKNATAERHALSAFHYLIFGANISDCAAPLFCQACNGAVLVITANHTRREAALRAKETVLSFNAELLGAVLVNRTFPVPEAIYRRL